MDLNPIVDGRSYVLSAPEGAYERVLWRDNVKVEHRPVQLSPGPVTVLR